MKAILVIDMPTTCEDCPCCITHENQYGNIVSAQCGAIYKGWVDERTFEKHELCPLKPLPKKKLVLEHIIDGNRVNDSEVAEAHGYNKCIEELEK